MLSFSFAFTKNLPKKRKFSVQWIGNLGIKQKRRRRGGSGGPRWAQGLPHPPHLLFFSSVSEVFGTGQLSSSPLPYSSSSSIHPPEEEGVIPHRKRAILTDLHYLVGHRRGEGRDWERKNQNGTIHKWKSRETKSCDWERVTSVKFGQRLLWHQMNPRMRLWKTWPIDQWQF